MPRSDTYDLNVILEPTLSDAQVQAEKDAVEAQVKRAEGSIDALDEWGSQRLAYPIRKFNEGYYLIYRLTLPVDKPKSVEFSLRQRDNVMRVLVVKQRPEWRTLKQPQTTEAEAASAS